jgi:hypothetical protein
MFKPEEIAELKLIRPELVTVTRTVCDGPCLLFSAMIASDGSGEADGALHNGSNAGDEKLYDLFTVDESMDGLHLIVPVCFSKGLHVVVGTNVSSITIHYRKL